MHRAVTLTTLAMLLFAVAGAGVARESVFEGEMAGGTIPSGATVPETTLPLEETTVAPETTEPEELAPPAVSPMEARTPPERVPADEDIASEPTGDDGAEQRPIREGKPEGRPGGNSEKGPSKTTLCHKEKKTITVGKPAEEAHLRHGDARRACGAGIPRQGRMPGKR